MAKKKKESAKYFYVTAIVTLELQEQQIRAESEEDAKNKFSADFKSELGIDISGNNLIRRYNVEYIDAEELDKEDIDMDLVDHFEDFEDDDEDDEDDEDND